MCIRDRSYGLFHNNYNGIKNLILSIESLHNFSLIHDDVMDNASKRRGFKTINSKWSNNQAILSGDVLLLHSYNYLIRGNYSNEIIDFFTKTSIEIPNILQNRIFKYFENAIKESQKYRQHTKRAVQGSTKQNKKLVTMWLKSNGISKFVRNVNHPFVKITQSSNNEEIRKLIDNLYDCFMPVNKRPETSLDHIIRSDKELFLIKEISSKTLDVIEGDIQEIEPYNTILKPINTYL